ncbi:MAG TPA: phosphate/phosphite/phosphonate ABC transporter substrate-binding protein [Nitrospirae bacterium]|nr:phosphate-import protein PhnD precursor [bacterium BMS3Abin06]HDH12444.1 phosphate/phosphite/phosphonate ABC transporter substrate-binding protein [Nitrospirota bacterium]HDZ02419.1 phosphate/phosphite/phosphonate ABC transporter substrate-binding protein [Nitrospirota bacterium]
MVKVFILICVIIISGCSKQETTSPDETTPSTIDTTLVIGLIPERNIFNQIERYEPITGYVAEKTGVNIKLKVLTRYGNIIDNFVSAGLDGAFFGSFTYTLAHAKLGVEVLARPQYIDGTSTYHGLIFVRRDSGIKTVKEMKGKIFAFVDKATTAGYLVPLFYFKEHGIDNYRTYFKETYFTGTHQDAIYDVLNKKADIGAAKNTVYRRLADVDKRITKELVILEEFLDVPENGLAVRKDLDVSIKNNLKEALLNMHNDPAGKSALRDFGAEKFIETTDNDYANVYKYTKEINLDLATYDYINE